MKDERDTAIAKVLLFALVLASTGIAAIQVTPDIRMLSEQADVVVVAANLKENQLTSTTRRLSGAVMRPLKGSVAVGQILQIVLEAQGVGYDTRIAPQSDRPCLVFLKQRTGGEFSLLSFVAPVSRITDVSIPLVSG